MLRFSANLGFLWNELPLLDRVAAAAQAGFRAVELHWPYDVPAAEMRAACERNQVSLLGLNTLPGDTSKGEFGLGALAGREDEFQAAMDQSIRYCLEAGGSAVHAMAGVVAPEAWAASRNVLRGNIVRAADKASAAGLVVLLEPINPRDKPGYFYSTVAEAASLIEEIGHPAVKLLFDAYHIGVSEGDVITKLRRHLGIIGHVQIAAVPSRAEPDEGEIAYRAIFNELESLRYPGWIGCEYRPRTSTDAGLGWTKALSVVL